MKKCSAVDCETVSRSRGLCDKHYRRLLKTVKPRGPRQVCSVDGCTGLNHAKGLCAKHYHRERSANGEWRPKPLTADEFEHEVSFLLGTDKVESLAARLGYDVSHFVDRLQRIGRPDLARRASVMHEMGM